jgi:hypothetical protein
MRHLASFHVIWRHFAPTQFLVNFKLFFGRYKAPRNLNPGFSQAALEGAHTKAHFIRELFFCFGDEGGWIYIWCDRFHNY